MSKLAAAAVVLAALLALMGNRWMNDRASAGFVMVDFTPVYLWSQWAGFLLAVGAAIYYASRWRSAGDVPKMGIVAGLLVLFFVAERAPFTWDASQWTTRDVVGKWRRERRDRASREAALPRFQGSWKSDQGEYEFQPDSLAIKRGSQAETVSARGCEFSYSLRYRMSTMYGFPFSDEANRYLEGLDFSTESPLLEAECGNARYTFLIRPDGKMLGSFMSGQGETRIELLTRR